MRTGSTMKRIPGTAVRDVANLRVVTALPDTTLTECAQIMRVEHVGSIIVVDREQPAARPVGIVTDRDIVLQAVALALDPDALTVGDVMSPLQGTVGEGDDALDALARMR